MKKSNKKVKYWQDLEVPAKLFFDVLDTQNPNKLIISGKPKEQDLSKAWDDIFDSYFKEKDSLELKLILDTQYIVHELSLRIETYKLFTEIIFYSRHSPEIIKEWIKKLNKVRLRIDPNKPINEEVLRINKSIIPSMQTTLELEIENLKNLTAGKKVKFYEMLAAISTKFHIPETISMNMFLGYEKTLTKK